MMLGQDRFEMCVVRASLTCGHGLFYFQIRNVSLSIPSNHHQQQDGRAEECHFLESSCHVEIDLSFNVYRDHHFVRELIEQIAQQAVAPPPPPPSQPSSSVSQSQETNEPLPPRCFKMIVIHQAHLLSEQAQGALRQIIEKHSRTCRFLFCTTSLTRMIEALRSHCMVFRIARPAYDEISVILSRISRTESIDIDDRTIDRIASESKRNLFEALLMLEATWKQHRAKKSELPSMIVRPLWKDTIQDLVRQITQLPNLKQLSAARPVLTRLLHRGVSETEILEELTLQILAAAICQPVTFSHELIQIAAQTVRKRWKYVFNRNRPGIDTLNSPRIAPTIRQERQFSQCSKPILCLEVFIAEWMVRIEKFQPHAWFWSS
jgi:DNA polymerase III delta prime subunit